MSMKREAFHTLLAKLRLAMIFFSEKRMSLPGAFPVTSVRRRASAPYWSMTSRGSIPLPKDLLILASLFIPHKTVDEHIVERTFSGVLIAGKYHTDHPEENDVVAGHKHVGRIEVIKVFGLLRPSQCGERPQSGAEPGVQRILILCEVLTSAFRADVGWFLETTISPHSSQ